MSLSVQAPLGLLGGTFDPVHNAHIALAHAAMRELGLSGVRWIPSGQPGHRNAPATPVEHRLAMLRLAIAGEPRFTLDEADALSAMPTYTVNTLARLRAELGPDVPLVFIIGADQLAALDTWRDWRRLFDSTHIAVAERPGYPVERERLPAPVAAELATREAATLGNGSGNAPAGRILRFAMAPLDVSATAIRSALASGTSSTLSGLPLPPPVLSHIQSHALYRNTTP